MINYKPHKILTINGQYGGFNIPKMDIEINFGTVIHKENLHLTFSFYINNR